MCRSLVPLQDYVLSGTAAYTADELTLWHFKQYCTEGNSVHSTVFAMAVSPNGCKSITAPSSAHTAVSERVLKFAHKPADVSRSA